jgi:hypothetical protein
LLRELKSKLLERSSNGINEIRKIFEAMDENQNHLLHPDDFRWGFLDYGV